jgi:type II secretory pathway pseudopilin PulG
VTAKARTQAFTLAELMIAMAITAVVGLTVVTVASALSYAHGQADAVREAVQSARTGLLRTEACLRKSQLVTAADADAFACWTGDLNEDRAINVDEIVVIRYQPASRTLQQRQVVFPPTLAPALVEALNVTKTLAELTGTAQADGVIAQPLYANYVSTVVLATDVDGFEVVPDAAPPFTRLLLLRLVSGQGTQRLQLTSAARLRADAVDSVFMVGPDAVLRLD